MEQQLPYLIEDLREIDLLHRLQKPDLFPKLVISAPEKFRFLIEHYPDLVKRLDPIVRTVSFAGCHNSYS